MFKLMAFIWFFLLIDFSFSHNTMKHFKGECQTWPQFLRIEVNSESCSCWQENNQGAIITVTPVNKKHACLLSGGRGRSKCWCCYVLLLKRKWKHRRVTTGSQLQRSPTLHCFPLGFGAGSSSTSFSVLRGWVCWILNSLSSGVVLSSLPACTGVHAFPAAVLGMWGAGGRVGLVIPWESGMSWFTWKWTRAWLYSELWSP